MQSSRSCIPSHCSDSWIMELPERDCGKIISVNNLRMGLNELR